MTVRAIIQARMLSSRLRGKSLMHIGGIPLLHHVVNSITRFSFVDEILIATTTNEAANPIEQVANDIGVMVFRGDPLNVLKRFYDASSDLSENDTIVRVTADNPLYNANIAQKVFHIHLEQENDYTHIDNLSHVVPEFIKVSALRKVQSLASQKYDQEHVTPFIRTNKELFKIGTLPSNFEGLNADMNKLLTIDTEKDFERFEELSKTIDVSDNVDFNRIYYWLENSFSEKE